jgi:hypothetical protein
MTRTFLYMDNFRGFSDTFVPLKSVNFLVGENSTGKSSFLELLGAFFAPAFWALEPTLRAAPLYQRHFLDLVSISSKNRSKFTIGVILESENVQERLAILMTYASHDGRASLVRYTRATGTICNSLALPAGATSRIKEVQIRSTQVPEHIAVESFRSAALTAHSSRAKLRNVEVPEQLLGSPLLLRFEVLLNPLAETNTITAQIPRTFAPDYVTLAPIRTKPLRTYDQPQTPFSPEGSHTPYLIKKQLGSKVAAEQFRTSLHRIGAASGLFRTLNIKQYGRGPQAPFELDIVLDQHDLSMDNVGYGVSQALPIFVEMLSRSRGSTFAIQQPEVHLHPRAQAAVGDLIAELAVHEQKRFFVETHSDFTIDRFRINLKRNRPSELDAQILFFERIDGGNRVTSIPIDNDGTISADQPDAYRAFFLNEQLELLA